MKLYLVWSYYPQTCTPAELEGLYLKQENAEKFRIALLSKYPHKRIYVEETEPDDVGEK